ncbi:Calmodulin-binding protein 60 A [Vitis vinifera]|uniref:Calmodulin-binding protein 60 A n=1 Tax=Vitis vinifera TaxID=29760 RepID=A0A438KAK3_VITVI|nr:Calmodulin-binding protein 60 A [Vitis vinifera]
MLGDVAHNHRLHQHQSHHHRWFCTVELDNVAEAPRRGWEGSIGGGCPEDKKRKVPSLKNYVDIVSFFCFSSTNFDNNIFSAILEVMKMQSSVQHLMEPILEPLIRKVVNNVQSVAALTIAAFSFPLVRQLMQELIYQKKGTEKAVVKEEVETALRKHLSNMKRDFEKELHPFESRSLQLQFSNALSLPVFTGTRIEGEDCSSIQVALVDGLTGEVVKSGPESSARVEIVVLEGDFDGDEGDNWTLEEFKNNIISFTDNSSWTRSRKFRLGARVVDNSDGTRIREAKTESFIVRDHRGE